MKRLSFFLFFFLSFLAVANAQEETPNARQARRIFNTAYERVFGPQGASLHYKVNIIGIYKTEGTISFKEKKQRFTDERVDTWNDGVTAYMAYRKKRTVEIHKANSDKKDKYSGRFKFSLDDFDYSVAKDPEGLMLTLKQKKKAKGTIKEVKALVEQGSYAPKRLRIKVAFIWTTVQISDFKSGGISDNLFVFPHEKFKEGWKFVDKR
ncbi:hypothetical protein L6475_07150 [Prevotella sp. E9-3]|uniref:hypothetical protein n=1 Tax=Prevotella sp. E9-3 TaxID=2913621 RepID=UPI001ED9DD42|nr:hypothetical protein [Prevotella sp. E9-3]UKK47023.1 hypothetical protein L6475_07150 [Prevotella sp. E9-3]